MPEKTPAQKLLIKPGQAVRLVNAPEDVIALLGGLPVGAAVVEDDRPANQQLLFANNRAELEALLPGARGAAAPQGIIWVLYHKGTSRVKTDINRDTIVDYAQTIQMQGVAMVAINDDWAALRLKLA